VARVRCAPDKIERLEPGTERTMFDRF
jgi:hypothetical protein